jgi:programmed cell death 6-interacting protein
MRGASSHQLLRFAWRDAGSGKAPKASSSAAGHTSLKTEHAVTLFALAAELARAAAEEGRRTPDGIRRACAALADAAGALSVADAKVCVASEASGLRYMTGTRLAAFECLELAQAHECYFELAVAGGKPASLCSKIAEQVRTRVAKRLID